MAIASKSSERVSRRGLAAALSRSHKRFTATPYLFLIPFLVVFSGFMLYPIGYSLVLSFGRWSAGNYEFIGLNNYRQLFADHLFWTSLGNTGLFLLVQVPLMLLMATILASLLNSDALKFKGALQTFFFLPALVDLVTYSIIFSMLFNESNGIINQVLSAVGIGAVPWRTDVTWAKVMIIIVITWRWLGYNTIILLAGLKGIDGELYEAAEIDGAGAVQQFTRITVPMLKPILLFCMLLSTIGTLQLFAEPYILTGGGPNHATSTVMLYLYDKGFGSFNFGLASAGAYVVTTLIGILAFIQIKATRGGEI